MEHIRSLPPAALALCLLLGSPAASAPGDTGEQKRDELTIPLPRKTPKAELELEGPFPRFVEPGAESGLTEITHAAKVPWNWVIDNIGTGVAVLDYDNDGDLDVFQVQALALDGFPGQTPPTDHLYRNEGNGTFRKVTAQAGFHDSAWGQGVTVGDYDNDGDPDIFVSSYGPDRLYRNEGDGTFREVGAEAGVNDDGWATGTAFFDYDNDGLLDLYVARYVIFDHQKIPPRDDPDTPCTYKGIAVVCGPMSLPQAFDILYRNNGDGTFSDVNRQTGMIVDDPKFGLGVITGDMDNDGDQDIFVGNDSEPNFLYINDGKGGFSEEGLIMGVAYAGDGRGQASMGVALGDPDSDGDFDMFVNHFASDYSTYYENDGTGFFEDQTLKVGLVEPMIVYLSWGTAFLDFDNDGDEDIFSANGHVYPEATKSDMGSEFLQACQVFLNDGKGRFTELTGEAAGPALSHPAAHRGAAFGDMDNDGDVDVLVTRMFERLAYFRNDLPAGNQWISVRLHGTRSNRSAIGTRMVVHAGGKSWLKEIHGGGSFQSANDPRLHVGLGGAARVDRIEIRWPSGLQESRGPFEAGQFLTFIEPADGPAPGGSPPARPSAPAGPSERRQTGGKP